jgi:hypothetical protein
MPEDSFDSPPAMRDNEQSAVQRQTALLSDGATRRSPGRFLFDVTQNPIAKLSLVATVITLAGITSGLMGGLKLVVRDASTAPRLADLSLGAFTMATVGLGWIWQIQAKEIYGSVDSDTPDPTWRSWRRRLKGMEAFSVVFVVTGPGVLDIFGEVSRAESVWLWLTTGVFITGVLFVANREVRDQIASPPASWFAPAFTVESAVVLVAAIAFLPIGVAAAQTRSASTRSSMRLTVKRPEPPIGHAKGILVSPSQVHPDVPLPPSAVSTAGPSQTAKPSSTCSVGPGGASLPRGISDLMIQASAHAAAESYGCLDAVIPQADGSYLQQFDNSPALLMGSPYGAGVVNDLVASEILASSPGALDLASLGGQPEDPVSCFSGEGDLQPFVGESGVITALWGRAELRESPMQIAKAVLPSYAQEVISHDVALVPLAQAVSSVGVTQQEFLNPLTHQRLFLLSSNPGPTITISELWHACTGGQPMPAWYSAP